MIKDQKKVLIFYQLSAITIFLYIIFYLLNIEYITFDAYQKKDEHNIIILTFIENDNKI